MLSCEIHLKLVFGSVSQSIMVGGLRSADVNANDAIYKQTCF